MAAKSLIYGERDPGNFFPMGHVETQIMWEKVGGRRKRIRSTWGRFSELEKFGRCFLCFFLVLSGGSVGLAQCGKGMSVRWVE